MHNQVNRQISRYLILVFVFAWTAEGLLILGEKSGILTGTSGLFITFLIIGLLAGLSPVYASAILFYRQKRISKFTSFLKLIAETPNTIKTVVLTLLFFIGLFLINFSFESLIGNPSYYYLLLFPLMILGGGMEEVGWRGYLQPLLERKFAFTLTSLIIGIIWGLWHLPLWFIQTANQSNMNYLSFVVYCIAFSFIIGLLYRITKSTFACVLLHAWGNTLQGMFTMNYLTQPLDLKLILTWTCIVLVIIGISHIADRFQYKVIQ